MDTAPNPVHNPAEKRAAALRGHLERGGSVRVTAFGSAERRDPTGRVCGRYADDVVRLGLAEGWLAETRRRATPLGEVVEYALRVTEAAEAKPETVRRPKKPVRVKRTVRKHGAPSAQAPKRKRVRKPAARKYPPTPQSLDDGTECITIEQAVERWGCSRKALGMAKHNRRVDVGPKYWPKSQGGGTPSVAIALTPKTLAYAHLVWVEGRRPTASAPRSRKSRSKRSLPPAPVPLDDGTECIARDAAAERWGCDVRSVHAAVGKRRVDVGERYRPVGAKGPGSTPIALTAKTLAYAARVWVRGERYLPPVPKPREMGPALPTSPNPSRDGVEALTFAEVADRYGCSRSAVSQALGSGRIDRGGPYRPAGGRGGPRTSVSMTERTQAYATAVWVQGLKPRRPASEDRPPPRPSRKRLPSMPVPLADGTPCESLAALAERYGKAEATVLSAVNDGLLDQGTTWRPDGTTGRGRTSVAMTDRSKAWIERTWVPRQVDLVRGDWLLQKEVVEALGFRKVKASMAAKLESVPQRHKKPGNPRAGRLHLVGPELVEAAAAMGVTVRIVDPPASALPFAQPAAEVAAH